ncbi:MAG TPA: sigma-70 family RNA polymerase sigma factor, partial [Gemmataceae bacterium]|nr:sigma-70 family RNA polymerase sigma factor [Gemmataceae bacterium]
MAREPLAAVIQHIHQVVGAPDAEELTDRQLLERFTSKRDESAFATLVRRHGELVLGVSRRILKHNQDAEDVFQATFLVLARKAASVRWHESVSNWLYAVAQRLALESRTDINRRRVREREAQSTVRPEALSDVARRELCLVLDEEMDRLPERYRGALLLCYLEGRTRDQAARQLAWSLRTLDRRLERGRELLRRRLTRRGVTLSAALWAVGSSQNSGTAAVPAMLAAATIKAAGSTSARALNSAAISANVAALVEGVLKPAGLAKLKMAGMLTLALSLLVAGAGLIAQKSHHRQQPEAKQVEPGKPADLKVGKEKLAAADSFGDP